MASLELKTPWETVSRVLPALKSKSHSKAHGKMDDSSMCPMDMKEGPSSKNNREIFNKGQINLRDTMAQLSSVNDRIYPSTD